MSANPWIKFYPSDWIADPAVRSCSLAARGLWFEMLCIMHEADPRGTLTIGSAPVSPRRLAALVGAPLREVNFRLKELEKNGVFSRDETGIPFSRRMKRETEKAERDRANGRAGGNPALIRGVNPKDNPQKLEARSQTPAKEEREEGKKEEARADARDGVLALPGMEAPEPPPKYEFNGEVIKLTAKDLAAWIVRFPMLDVKAELRLADAYYRDTPPLKPFFAAEKWLVRSQDRARDRKREEDRNDPFRGAR